MSSLLNQEQIHLLLTTKCTGIDLPSETVLLCVLKKRNKIIFRKVYENKHGVHAEMVMLEDTDFLTHFQQGQTEIDIFLTMNYSPCERPYGPYGVCCAEKLRTFYGENNEYIETFTIRFSAVYKNQYAGLVNLKEAGVILESMTEKSWFDLLIWSHDTLPDGIREKIKKRDESTRNELYYCNDLLCEKMHQLALTSKEEVVPKDGSSPEVAGKPGHYKERY